MADAHDRNMNPNPPMVYQIRLKGHLDDRWAEWFGGVAITLEAGGEMLLTCTVADQAALYGILRKVRNLGLPLVAVNRVDPGPTGDAPGPSHPHTDH